MDKDTRIIDVDFGPVSAGTTREVGGFTPATVTYGENGAEQIIDSIGVVSSGGGGSYIQYERVDLSYMLNQGEMMQPVDVSVQRTSPVPLGFSNNGNNFDQIEEYVYIFTRPLNNQNLVNGTIGTEYGAFRNMGLERSQSGQFGASVAGAAGWPDLEQCIYAEKRMYSTNLNLAATVTNGELLQTPDYNALVGMPVLDSVTTWGSLGMITGPNLHCYRVIIDRSQSFPGLAGVFANVDFPGSTLRRWPPVNVSFLCKAPNFSEGEYLTRLANAMASNAEGGPTA